MSLFSTFRTEKKLQGKDKKKWLHKNGSKPINVKTADTLSCFPLKRANTVLYTYTQWRKYIYSNFAKEQEP